MYRRTSRTLDRSEWLSKDRLALLCLVTLDHFPRLVDGFIVVDCADRFALGERVFEASDLVIIYVSYILS
jgi:hypothetical protein